MNSSALTNKRRGELTALYAGHGFTFGENKGGTWNTFHKPSGRASWAGTKRESIQLADGMWQGMEYAQLVESE